ncbi:MAG: YuiB family protein [Bacillales bacterium]|nr:YuiB family protein [Bacillales bacterium]
MLLFFVLFFGIGFILNMLLRKTWIMSILYPLIVLIIVDGINTFSYITHSREAFSTLGERLVGLKPADMMILLSGLAGAVLSGIAIKELRKKGYRMF